MGCRTGVHETQSLPHAAVQAGAAAAVGFKDTINCGTANEWTEYFFDLYYQGNSVETATAMAAEMCGNENNIDLYQVVTQTTPQN